MVDWLNKFPVAAGWLFVAVVVGAVVVVVTVAAAEANGGFVLAVGAGKSEVDGWVVNGAAGFYG